MGALDGKVALVTGGASGIGRATCELVAASIEGLFAAADCGDRASVDAAFASCEAELGGVDVAYLNAGVTTNVADITQLDDAGYHRIQRVNVDGVFFGVRAAIGAMERR